MLGRNSYTQEEIDHGRSAAEKQLAAYRKLVKAATGEGAEARVQGALENLEPLLFNNMTMVLDRHFVHRVRTVGGKDSNPLNEVELICESLMNNDGILRGNNVIKYVPEQTVLELALGDQIRLSADQFERLATAFLAEIESRCLES